jgi:nucleotide-binding universal stress UspA family protein
MIRLKQILVATDFGEASAVATDYGRGAVAQLLMGSVAERVVRTAPCPVLAVRHPEREFVVPDAVDATAKQESGIRRLVRIRLEHILVAMDFSEPSDAALTYGRALANTFNATLHLVHVVGNMSSEALRKLLKTDPGLHAIGEARHGREAVAGANSGADRAPLRWSNTLAWRAPPVVGYFGSTSDASGYQTLPQFGCWHLRW